MGRCRSTVETYLRKRFMKAVFPGSFDPITRGHLSVLEAVLPLFDIVYVAIGVNAAKQGCFLVEQRKQWIRQAVGENKKVEIIDYNGLTIDLCKQLEAPYLIRGLRNSIDFQYEKDIAEANQLLWPDLETIFIPTRPELACISSSVVRDVFKHGGDCSAFLPEGVILR